MTLERIQIGRRGEQLALDHYLRLGYTSVATNARTRHGEIDLIVTNGSTLVFAEVKTRLAASGNPINSFTPAKQRQVRRMTANWLAANARPRAVRELRLDAVAVTLADDGSLVSLECLEGAL
jgi:putative endonuclease